MPGGNEFKTKNFCMKDTGTILIYEDKVVMKGLYLIEKARTVSIVNYSPLSSFSFPSEEGYSSSSLTQSSLELSVSSPEQCRIYPVSEFLE